MRKPDNLVALHYEMTGSYVVDASPLEQQPLDKWAMRQILEARQIIADLIDFCEQPEIVTATDGAFDPDAIIQRGKRFLSGGEG